MKAADCQIQKKLSKLKKNPEIKIKFILRHDLCNSDQVICVEIHIADNVKRETQVRLSCDLSTRMPSHQGHQNLVLPEQGNIAFRNLKDAKLFALDIGGSLTKIAYYSTLPVRRLIYEVDSSQEALT